MKKFLLIFILSPLFSYSQNTIEIENFLNNELKKERKEQLKNPNFDGDTLIVIQEFKIDTNHILSYQTQHKRYNGDGYFIRKQEVNLAEILSVGKDICVLLETENKIKITDFNFHQDGQIDTTSFNDTYFRTHFCSTKGNEGFGYELVELFKKAGFLLTISYWYD